ncbi:putative adipose-regulatory protein-domain-containing protein [Staphylotrichum tortipilum]|uniref:Adipose-regulatory protein-domain-containing protein n=1 Tax=Staphylotrichum tortipilum TaxID=2831512 RepID=A0AAN6RTJ9_9PEZI|nr:putative adipose-regulatory protein-domain-containing protein [Staphylotrichum longicolle]
MTSTPSVGHNTFGLATIDGLVKRQPYDITVSLTFPRSPSNTRQGNFMIALHLFSATPGTPLTQYQPFPYETPKLVTPTPRSNDDNPATARPVSWSTHPPSTWHHSYLTPTRLALPAYLEQHHIIFSSARPALIPYVDPLAETALRWLLLPYNVLFAGARGANTVHLAFPMAEALVFSAPAAVASGAGVPLPGSLLLEIHGGEQLQVYEARVTLAARLRGLQGFMYRWRVTSFVLFTGAFWMVEMGVLVSVVGVVLVGSGLLGRGGRGGGKGGLEEEEEEEDDDYGNGNGGKRVGDKGKGVEVIKAEPFSSAPSGESGKGKEVVKREEEKEEVKKEEVKKEEEETEGELAKVPEFENGQSADADDEAEDGAGGTVKAGQGRDVGVGTGFSGQGSQEGGQDVRRRASGQ